MKDININLGTALPKLATVLPLSVVLFNLIINVISNRPFTNDEIFWSVVGVITSLYFGLFCKKIEF